MDYGFKRTPTNSITTKLDPGPRKKEINKEIAFMLSPPLQGYKRKHSFSRATEKSDKKM